MSAATVSSAEYPVLAQPRNVKGADISRTAKQVWANLCDHRNKRNVAYPRIATIADCCGISVRTVQYGIKELLEKRWICLPNGDVGGRPPHDPFRRTGTAVQYHLHPDGRDCSLPKVELKQRAAAKKGAKSSPFCDQERVQKPTEKGAKFDSAYKEGTTMSERTTPTTTSRAREEAPNLEANVVAVAAEISVERKSEPGPEPSREAEPTPETAPPAEKADTRERAVLDEFLAATVQAGKPMTPAGKAEILRPKKPYRKRCSTRLIGMILSGSRIGWMQSGSRTLSL